MQGVIERAEFWLWWEQNKQDVGLYTNEEMSMYAGAYVIIRQDGQEAVMLWLERTKRQLQLFQSPLAEQWWRLKNYEQGYEEAA